MIPEIAARDAQHAADFRRSLRNGTGRAMRMLLESGCTPTMRDLLLEACLVDEVYDRQCEDPRDAYLYRLVVASGEQAFFRVALWRQLRETKEIPGTPVAEEQRLGLAQVFAILCRMADGQDEAAHRELGDWFDASSEELAHLCFRSVVRLQGLPGLLRCLARIEVGTVGHTDERAGLVGGLVYALRERDGDEAANAALPVARRQIAVLDQWLAQYEARTSLEPIDRQPVDYATFRRRLDETGQTSGGRDFTAAELVTAARDLLAERDPKRLRAYLLVFRRRPFPLPPDGLLPLLDHEDGRISWAAAYALRSVADDRVRDAALGLLSRGRAASAIRMLCANYRRGDVVAIGRALDAAADDDAIHSLGGALLDLAAENAMAAEEVAPLLVRLYEVGRCSICRRSAASLLAQLGAAPDWMARELPFDVDARAMAQGNALSPDDAPV